MDRDEHFMLRAMELASLGLGTVSPNPLVGCVVVCNDRIIGEGWHQKFGGPHAEVNALNSVADSSMLNSSTVYVNLEPCSHFGKTPPCADLLIEKKVRRVVVANRDPNQLVAGKGISQLRDAGIEIKEDVLQPEGRWLNRRFFACMEQGIPYIILKWAESADGFMAASGPTSVWISNVRSRQRVHQWRSQEDAVLVGSRTAEIDNPRLSVRDWSGRNPMRVVLDPSLRLPGSLHLFDGSQPTLLYNRVRDQRSGNLVSVKVSGSDMIAEVLQDLRNRNVGSVIIEGGPHTLNRFISGGWWHEARIIQSNTKLGAGVQAPKLEGKVMMTDDISGDRLTVRVNPNRLRNG
jgi:diaminohydroxyphosphoribosylaminopyrimidine deaminase / 5-amino-6-(5-phosphoribosylamino)uracil reductase